MTFVKDDPRINRDGRPVGTKNFETDFDEAVDEIAKENKMTRSEARKLLFKVAFKQAKDGNYSFYKDIHDRIYGQATAKSESKTDISVVDGLSNEEKESLKKLLINDKSSTGKNDIGNTSGESFSG